MQPSLLTSRLGRGALSLALCILGVGCGSSASNTADDGGVKQKKETGTASKDTGTLFLLPPHRDAGEDATKSEPDATMRADTGPPRPDTGAPRPDTGVPRDASEDTATVPDSGPPDVFVAPYPAFVPDAPQVLFYGGPVLSNPVFVPVFFSGEQYATELTDFLNAVGQSDYWTEAVSEYGVGPGTAAPPIFLDETMPSSITEAQITVWLQNRIGSDPRFLAVPPPDGGLPDGGATDADFGVSLDASAPLSGAISPTAQPPAQAIYVLYMPEGTEVVFSSSSSSCVEGGFGGYHDVVYYGPNGDPIIFAVIPRCSVYNGQYTGVQGITGATSHELAEGSTDPQPYYDPAYESADLDHYFWGIAINGDSYAEVGDMCEFNPNSAIPFLQPSSGVLQGYNVQRIWSNKAAAAGQDPCRPLLPTSEAPYYFNSVPNFGVVTFVLDTSEGPENRQTLGMVAPPNVPTMLEVDLFSSVSTDGQQWSVSLCENLYCEGTSGDLQFSPPQMGSNGDKLYFTVTNLNNDGSDTHVFWVKSTIDLLSTLWVGVATNQ